MAADVKTAESSLWSSSKSFSDASCWNMATPAGMESCRYAPLAVSVNSSTRNCGAAACATCGDRVIDSPVRAATRAESRRDLRMKDLLGGCRLRSESEVKPADKPIKHAYPGYRNRYSSSIWRGLLSRVHKSAGRRAQKISPQADKYETFRSQGAQVGETVHGQPVLALRQRPPDGGRGGDGPVVRGERLDDERPLIAGVAQGPAEARPVEAVGPRRAAIGAAHLHVRDAPGRLPHRPGGILLLDVHVVHVECQVAVLGRRVQRLLDGVDQAGLVPVERLDGELHPALGRVIQDGPQPLAQLGVDLPAFVRREPPGTADRGVGR